MTLSDNETSHIVESVNTVYNDNNNNNNTVITSSIPITEFDCSLCYELLYDIITLPTCSHNFCRLCIHKSIQTKPYCPLCRVALHNIDVLTLNNNSYIESLIQTYYTQQYDKRRLEYNNNIKHNKTNILTTKYNLFISSSPYFPGQTINLHIYEAKYRIMINHAINTNHKFVICYVNYDTLYNQTVQNNQRSTIINTLTHTLYPAQQHAIQQQQQQNNSTNNHIIQQLMNNTQLLPSNTVVHDNDNNNNDIANTHASRTTTNQPHNTQIGTLCEIKKCRYLADGRSLIEAVGITRVKLHNINEVNNSYGLLCADCEIINDIQTINDTTNNNNNHSDDTTTQPQQTDNNNNDTTDSNTTNSDSTDNNQQQNNNISHNASTSHTNQHTAVLHTDTNHINELTAEIYRRLDQYIQLNKTTMEQLTVRYGNIPTNIHELPFWISCIALCTAQQKYSFLQCNNVIERLQLALNTLDDNINKKQKTSYIQWHTIVILIAIIIGVIISNGQTVLNKYILSDTLSK